MTTESATAIEGITAAGALVTAYGRAIDAFRCGRNDEDVCQALGTIAGLREAITISYGEDAFKAIELEAMRATGWVAIDR